MDCNKMLFIAIKAAIDAGQAILEVYKTDFDVEKKEDQSPLTLADRRSHKIILDYLSPFGIPVLSEEGREVSYETRINWKQLWIVDPLDGTKEFIKRNDEFTVNIALVENQDPALGVIYLPVKDTLYFAEKSIGAYRLDNAVQFVYHQIGVGNNKHFEIIEILKQESTALPEEKFARADFTIVGSRSHATQELKNFVSEKEKELGKIHFISAGSSLKICLVAEGKADIYPRLGPTMEWDTAAGQAIAQTAGVEMIEYTTQKPLVYNKKDLLNPWFVVQRKKK